MHLSTSSSSLWRRYRALPKTQRRWHFVTLVSAVVLVSMGFEMLEHLFRNRVWEKSQARVLFMGTSHATVGAADLRIRLS